MRFSSQKITRYFYVLFISLAVLLNQTSKAQTSNGSIHGIVTDSATSKPIEFITIAIKKDNIPVKTVLTDINGKFKLNTIPFGKYVLTAIAMGYNPKNINIELSDNKNSIDIGKIILVSQVKNLNEVSVTASKPLIKQEIDRISYDIQADPESKALSVLDMMRKVPLLTLDADDNIKLKGSGNYKILINGKPSGMVARDPKEVLRSMPATSIQKIEVITTPPAKYDSEGLSGIINIITNKKVDNGYNGNLNYRHQFPFGGPGFGGYFTLKQGKFGLNVYGGSGWNIRPETDVENSRTGFGANPSYMLNKGTGKSKNNYNWAGAELSFEIDTLNLITAEINPYGGYYAQTNNQAFSLSSPNSITSYNILGENRYDWGGIDFSLNYQLGFKRNKDQLLTFSYKNSNSSEPQKNAISYSNQINFADPNYIQENDNKPKEQTIQIDYLHPIKKLNIEAGIKTILRDNDSDFEFKNFNSATGEYIIDLSKTNIFKNNQTVVGAYNSYAYKLEKWGFKAGIRIEETFVKADFISNASKIKTDYFNIIPTLSINRKFKDNSNLNFGFTQRIERPGIYNLNPFVDRSMPNYESTGNPDLKAVLSNNIDLSYSKFKKGSITIGLSYNFANNTIQEIAVYNDLDKITRSTFANIGKDKNLSSNLNITYPISNKWNMSLNGNIGYKWIEGFINGNLAKNKGLTGDAYLSSGYKFENTWKVNTGFNYSAPYISLQAKSRSYVYISVRGSKDIIKDKLTITAGINNPFSKYRDFTSTTEGANFIQNFRRQNFYRSFNTSLNWKFGKLKGEIKKNQRSINNDDVKSGSKSGS
jgi:outer membrane receptor protein involved in Fe transport